MPRRTPETLSPSPGRTVLGSGTRGGVCGLVLAAGAGRRFGSLKQLSHLAGRPLLEYALEAMSRASLDSFAVVLGAGADHVLATVDLQGAKPVRCLNWRDGQSASLRAGVAALGDSEAVVVTLGDQPLISAAAIDRVVAARSARAQAVRATYRGRPGHPVLMESSLLRRVPALRGDAGARRLLADASIVGVPCDDIADPSDVDEPARLGELERRWTRAGLYSGSVLASGWSASAATRPGAAR